MYYKEYYKQTAFDGQGLLLITCQLPTCYTKSGLFTPFMIVPRNFAPLGSIASYVKAEGIFNQNLVLLNCFSQIFIAQPRRYIPYKTNHQNNTAVTANAREPFSGPAHGKNQFS